MIQHSIKPASQLSAADIKIILRSWDVDEWKGMKTKFFKQTFEHSEFHLLVNSHWDILSVARIHFNFCIQIAGTTYRFAEFVGFVSVEKRQGYGTKLLHAIIDNLKQRGIETIGFCKRE